MSEVSFTKPRQNPLTVIATIKSEQDAQELRAKIAHFASMPDDQNPIVKALNAIGTVHFARFIFLDNGTKFGIITAYDGPLDKYLQDFATHIGPIFDAIHIHLVGGPPAPVLEHPQEFLDFVAHNSGEVVSFYCSYPELSVLDIRNMAATNP